MWGWLLTSQKLGLKIDQIPFRTCKTQLLSNEQLTQPSCHDFSISRSNKIRKYIFKGFIFHCYVGLPECRLISSPTKTNKQTTPKICWSLGIQSPPENSNGTSILCWVDSTSQSLADSMTGCLGDGNLTVSSLAPRFSSTRLFPEKSNMRCAKWAEKKQL